MKVDKRELFLNAWAIYRGQKVKDFSNALRRSWRQMKAACVEVVETVIEFKEQKMEQSTFFFFDTPIKLECGDVLQ